MEWLARFSLGVGVVLSFKVFSAIFSKNWEWF